jgi:7-keto-8-aminopelargonate synthetase-like enzyme
VHAVRAPTVPNNKPRIRITLNSLHERADIERLLDHIQREMNG